jgi:uncharacterized protein (DUF362 family)
VFRAETISKEAEVGVVANRHVSRREFIGTGARLALGAVTAGAAGLYPGVRALAGSSPPAAAGVEGAHADVVSIVRIKKGKIDAAVEEAIDLLGGVRAVTAGKQKIMLKPNLVFDDVRATTKPIVVETLARLLKSAGKEVSIGEGSGGAGGFNVVGATVFRTKRRELIEAMQRHVFEKLGYASLAKQLDLPLVNLHAGHMVTVPVPGGLAYRELQLQHSLTEIDLLCSVPMMKTHAIATVTLGMKNLVGLYAGTVYGTLRSAVHNHAADLGSPGVAYEILDMVRANKLGLVVVDGSTAMEGNGPNSGPLVAMDLIIAGTNPLATDMVASAAMGIEPHEVPTFVWANRIGMRPTGLHNIEIRGAPLESVRRRFLRPHLVRWNDIRPFWGAKEL